MKTTNFTTVLALTGVVLLGSVQLCGQAASGGAPATQSSVDQDVDLIRKDIRSQKKQIIAANLHLTDTEAEKFWPVYDQYTAELVKINDQKYAAIKEYAQNYDSLTDGQATSLMEKEIAVDGLVAQLRAKYLPIVGKVIPGRKTALFFQLDRRLVMLIDIQLVSAIPMVQPPQ
jgi:hypothetical protein